jgi:hypothetical protein
MDFHFVKLIHEGTYLSLVDPKEKPRFICFAERSKADKCVDYMADFRYRNRIWPSFDMSYDRRKLKMGEKVLFPYGTPRIIKRSLAIESFDFNTIDRIARQTNVSYYCILNFDVIFSGDSETISLSGQEMDGIADPDDFGEWMDFSLKTK